MEKAKLTGADEATGANIEFWFEFASTYSYLSVMRVGNLARASGVRIVWRPFVLGPIFRAFGWSTSPFLLQKEKGAYMWTDMERQCRKFGLRWHRPTEFPRHSVLPARVALLGVDQPWLLPFAQEVMLANFARDQDIACESVIEDLLGRLGLPAQELLRAAQLNANKARLRTATEEAQRRGVFGAPTFFVGEEMFWGNDRLDDAVAFAHIRAAADTKALSEFEKS
jgi:2-hydroxychromene-2-carboxylate isomerase